MQIILVECGECMEQELKYDFEPIVSLDEMHVVGFQIVLKEGQEQLFVYDETRPNEMNRLVTLYKQLFHRCLEDETFLANKYMLYIPVDANALVLDFGEVFLEELQLFNEKGMAFEKMVVQIEEENFIGDVENLYYLIRYYRTYNILFAIDHHEMGKSNLETIRLLKPDILKINMSSKKIQNFPVEAQDLLSTLASLMRVMGTTILFDHIRSDIHLYNAWKNSGRYLAGQYVFEPVVNICDAQKDLDYIRKDMIDFVFRENKRLSKIFAVNGDFNQRCEDIFKNRKKKEFDEWFEDLKKEFSTSVYRMYFVDGNGIQISGNYITRTSGKWEKSDKYIGRNWSFRPYFLKGIAKLRHEKRGTLSSPYADLKSKKFIRTFSYPIYDDMFLFMDLKPDYLYENNLLL